MDFRDIRDNKLVDFPEIRRSHNHATRIRIMAFQNMPTTRRFRWQELDNTAQAIYCYLQEERSSAFSKKRSYANNTASDCNITSTARGRQICGYTPRPCRACRQPLQVIMKNATYRSISQPIEHIFVSTFFVPAVVSWICRCLRYRNTFDMPTLSHG